jgi:hypothetical protein
MPGGETTVAVEDVDTAELDEMLAGKSTGRDDNESEDELILPVVKVSVLVLRGRAELAFAVDGDDVTGVLDGDHGVCVLSKPKIINKCFRGNMIEKILHPNPGGGR